MSAQHIELRGVAVHNLKEIDLDIPHRQLVVICGVSGSGKTSLALDTLYAEGQRRYVESFSAYTRQFLERLEKPLATRIDGIPPSIAVTQQAPSRSNRANVGTATEIIDYLRLLMARIGTPHCYQCGREVRQDSPDSVVELLSSLNDRSRYMVLFRATSDDDDKGRQIQDLQEDGFVRIVMGEQTMRLDELSATSHGFQPGQTVEVVVDRLNGGSDVARVRDSLETAFLNGQGRATILLDAEAVSGTPWVSYGSETRTVDEKPWLQAHFHRRLACVHCELVFPDPSPKLYSFNSPLGACPTCEGFGDVVSVDMNLVVPDANKSIRDGAIAPWSTPSYVRELDKLLAVAPDGGIPVDIPFHELSEEHVRLIREGVAGSDFGGLDRFFDWLDKRKYKMHHRVFLSRWRSHSVCPECSGTRLRMESLATRLGAKNVAEICSLQVREAEDFFRQLPLTPLQQQTGKLMLDQVQARLEYLRAVGLEYLTLDRPLRTLSGGEAQRVALTSALGSSLVNMLYVLDEPSVGLHPQDTQKLLESLYSLRDRGNSVIVVEHEEAVLRHADQLVEIGPGAGESGGHVIFQGTPTEILTAEDSLTGDYLAGRRGVSTSGRRRPTNHGWIKITGARGNNLQNITVEFPLGVLCVVTGVSGAGKSTLVEDSLYPALCRRKRKDGPTTPAMYEDVFGDGQIDDVIMVDQNPIGRSPRSNPVTYLKAFDAIRAVFAETVDARTHNYTASHFSFNVDGGRCSACSGDGFKQIDMQFMADIFIKCSQCHGKRYRREILDVKYRGRNIADVLEMSARQAYTFFRGQDKVQAKLKRLLDVGLEYLRLGQPANNLSSGEAQRLKLAGYLSTVKRNRTLFLMDEPTTGLHFNDVVNLLDCIEALLTAGHSLIVIEHNLQMIKAADYVIDLGPGAAKAGGQIVAQGSPEVIARSELSATGRYLRTLVRGD